MSVYKFILNTIPRPFLIKISYWVKPLISFYLRGSKYTDPIDGKSFRKFLSYGYGTQRENVLAPGTLSLERHRLLWLYLKTTPFFKKTYKLLHIAPEQCFYKLFKTQDNLDYLTSDLFSPLADVKADICHLPFEDNSYDIIFCNHVLEHIEDDQKAMRELYRVLKTGGYGIFQIPQDLTRQVTYENDSVKTAEDRKIHFGQYDHVRVYGKDYFNKLREIGFKVEEIASTDLATPEQIARYRLSPTEILPVCRKV
jgi:SAM-dependent methyltransferase